MSCPLQAFPATLLSAWAHLANYAYFKVLVTFEFTEAKHLVVTVDKCRTVDETDGTWTEMTFLYPHNESTWDPLTNCQVWKRKAIAGLSLNFQLPNNDIELFINFESLVLELKLYCYINLHSALRLITSLQYCMSGLLHIWLINLPCQIFPESSYLCPEVLPILSYLTIGH